jgi:hypothetical protein
MRALRLLLTLLLLPVDGSAAAALKAKLAEPVKVKTAQFGYWGASFKPELMATAPVDMPQVLGHGWRPFGFTPPKAQTIASVEQALDIMADVEQPKLAAFDGAYEASKADFVHALHQMSKTAYVTNLSGYQNAQLSEAMSKHVELAPYSPEVGKLVTDAKQRERIVSWSHSSNAKDYSKLADKLEAILPLMVLHNRHANTKYAAVLYGLNALSAGLLHFNGYGLREILIGAFLTTFVGGGLFAFYSLENEVGSPSGWASGSNKLWQAYRARVTGRESLGTKLKKLFTHPANFRTFRSLINSLTSGPMLHDSQFSDAAMRDDPAEALSQLRAIYRRMVRESIRFRWPFDPNDPLLRNEPFETGLDKLILAHVPNSAALLHRLIRAEAIAAAKGDLAAGESLAAHLNLLHRASGTKVSKSSVELLWRELALNEFDPQHESMERVASVIETLKTF